MRVLKTFQSVTAGAGWFWRVRLRVEAHEDAGIDRPAMTLESEAVRAVAELVVGLDRAVASLGRAVADLLDARPAPAWGRVAARRSASGSGS